MGGAGAAGLASGGGAGAAGTAALTGGAGDGGSQGQAGAAQQAGPAQILCLGDSITEQAASWIYPLQDTLRADTCRYEFIGLDQSPYNGEYVTRDGYENKRVAAGGFSTTGILNLIKEQGMGGVPDVVVEYLGVNNVYGGFIDGKYNPNNSADPDGSYIKDNKELFAMVREKNPKATFLLMKIENNLMPEIDAAIDELVATESTAQSPVIAVANAANVDTSDGVHPTAAGATTLAGPVGKALVAWLTAEGNCTP